MALKRFVNGAAGEAFFQKRAPDNRPEWLRTVDAVVPVGPDGRRDRRRRRGGPRLDRQPRLHRPEPAPGPRGRPRPPRRAARRPRPGARAWRGRRSATSRWSRRSRSRRSGLVGWPKTSGSRGIHVNVRIERRWTYPEVRRAALAIARDVERRAPDDRDLEVVEGGAPRRLPRLQPERQGPDGRVRVLRAAAARMRGSRRRCRGTRCRPSRPRRSRSRRCRRGSPTIGDPGAGIDEAVGSLEARPGALAPRTRPRARATRRGRRTTASRRASRRASSRRASAGRRRTTTRPRPRRSARRTAPRWSSGSSPRPSGARRRRRPATPIPSKPDADGPAPVERAGHRDLAGEDEGRGARGPRALEGRAIPTAAAALEEADVLVDGMRGRSSLWYRVRVNLTHVPEADRPAAGGPRGRLRPVGRVRLPRSRRPARARAAQAKGARLGRLPGYATSNTPNEVDVHKQYVLLFGEAAGTRRSRALAAAGPRACRPSGRGTGSMRAGSAAGSSGLRAAVVGTAPGRTTGSEG